MAEAICDTCAHWRHEGEGNAARFGRCTLNPPSPGSSPTEPGVWPITLHHSTCGQHKPKPETKPAPARAVEQVQGAPVADARETRPATATQRRGKRARRA